MQQMDSKYEFHYFHMIERKIFILVFVVCYVLVVCSSQESIPKEWRSHVEENSRLFSKSVFSRSRTNHPSAPLLVPSIGNGYIATVVGSTTLYIGGLFNGKNHNGVEMMPSSHRARVPSYLNLNITNGIIDYEEHAPNGKRIHPGGFAIDTKQGVFYERFFVGGDNSKAQIEQRRYCHRRYPSILLHEIHIDNSIANEPEVVELKLTINAGMESEDISFASVQETDEYSIMQGSITIPELKNSLQVSVAVVFSRIPETITVQPNQKITMSFILAARTNIPGDLKHPTQQPWEAALIDFQRMKKLQNNENEFQRMTPLMKEHIDEWDNEIWKHGALTIKGNDDLSKVVQSSIYWILMSTRPDWPWSLSPGSLASNAYNGHSFWDCETWMYPPLLLLYPDIAESLLKYRFNHLEAAKAKAKGYNHCGDGSILLFDCIIWPPDQEMWKSMSRQNQIQLINIVQGLRTEVIKETDIYEILFENSYTTGSDDNVEERNTTQGNCNYKGALFAWEAGFTGAEVCPCMAGGTCLHEHHISGDIAFAAYQYWQATHDEEWLRTVGYPLVFEIATFWASRVEFNGQKYEIRNIIPPDEAAMGVHNSVFTNVVAKYSFIIAKEFSDILTLQVPSEWLFIANNMKIPFDHHRQVHLEHDNFSANVIKQADVVLLGYPLQYPMDPAIRENDLNYYSAITSHRGPAMTWSVTSIGYREVLSTREMENQCKQRELSEEERTELTNKAEFYFFQSYQNAQPPYYIWTETPFGGAYNFITGAGGFLQGLMSGYGGIRLKSDGFHIIYPSVPQNTTSFSLEMVNFLGNEFDIYIWKDIFSLTLRTTGDVILRVEELDFCSTDLDIISAKDFVVGESLSFPAMTHIRLRAVKESQVYAISSLWYGSLEEQPKNVFIINILSAITIGLATVYFLIILLK